MAESMVRHRRASRLRGRGALESFRTDELDPPQPELDKKVDLREEVAQGEARTIGLAHPRC